jgi:hypothetical protein
VTSIAERDVEKWQAIDCGHNKRCSTVVTGLIKEFKMININIHLSNWQAVGLWRFRHRSGG